MAGSQSALPLSVPGTRQSSAATKTAKKGAYQNDAAESLPRMDSALGVQLDGAAVKENAEASGNLLNVESRFDPLVRGRVVRRSLFDPLTT